MDEVLAAVESARERLVQELQEFLRIPSVSADSRHREDVLRCAEWLADAFAAAGLTARVEPTGGHPAVVAEWRGAPGAPTVLVYGHYDVQPPDPLAEWTSDPFEPVVRDGRLVGRGATDDKGQLYCHLAGVRAHLASRGSLPVNVVFLVEGEEESGSGNLEPFVVANRERLACDAVVVSDSAQFGPGVPALTYGLRGLTYLEIEVRGPARDLHSGSFGGAVRNPASAVAAILAGLHEPNGRVSVPGFYDEVRPLEEWEREAFRQLPFNGEGLRRDLGVPAFWGEEGFSVLERIWARPTLDVNGVWSGYCGEGAKTVLPARAGAKLSCRLVPDQDPKRIADRVEARLRALCPEECTLRVGRLHDARPVLLPVDSPPFRAAGEALRRGFGAEPVLTREGGSIPVVEALQRVLGAPVVLMGFGRPDDGAHGPDEKFELEDLYAGVRTSAWLWQLLASA